MALMMPWPQWTLKRQLQQARELPQVIGAIHVQAARIGGLLTFCFVSGSYSKCDT